MPGRKTRRDPQTIVLERQLGLSGLRAQAAVDLLFDRFTSPEDWAERWGQLGPAVLGQIRRRVIAEAMALSGEYLAGYGQVVPDDYRPTPGRARSWESLASRAVPQARARMASQGMSLAEALGVERRFWQGLATGEPHRVARQSVADTATRWARIPEAGACDFCEMLATRGAAYYTGGGGDPATRGALRSEDPLQYHDRCRCVAQPVEDPIDIEASKLAGKARWEQLKAEGRVPKINRSRRVRR